MSLISTLGVALLYGWCYGVTAGVCAGMLSGFSLFALHIATFPIRPETDKAREERERLNRDVAALVLITAVFGCAISSLLAG